MSKLRTTRESTIEFCKEHDVPNGTFDGIHIVKAREFDLSIPGFNPDNASVDSEYIEIDVAVERLKHYRTCQDITDMERY